MSAAAGAAAEAVAAVEAPAAPVEGTPAPEGQAVEGATPAVAAKPPISEVVRLAREKQRLERKVAELEKRGAPEPVQQHAAVTRDSVVAELKKQYEDDPEAFLAAVAGEDFYKLAARVAKKSEAPEDKVAALEREIAELKGRATNEDAAKQTEAQKAADRLTERHIAEVAKEVEAVDAEGNHKYPTLATLDPEALDEPVALTAYNAVAYVHARECMKDGKIVKTWTPAEAEARFGAAFAALEAHYGKLRTPKSPGTQSPQSPDPAPTISNQTSNGTADRPETPAPGTLPWHQALRVAMKERGLSQ